MVRTGRNQVRRVGAERTVPYPPLVTGEGGLERIWRRLLIWSRLNILHLPDLGCMVCATGGQLLDVWG